MAPPHSSSSLSGLETVIFVDVDGVLNVGARDGANSGGPLLINQSNIQRARSIMETGESPAESQSANRIVAVSERPLGQFEKGTLSSMAANEYGFSDILVGRLAELILSATAPKVVLASSWRHTRHRPRAEKLRREIEKKLGREFRFDDHTPVREDTTAQERLRCIGEYMAQMRLPATKEARLLVLDDLFITAFSGWSCDGSAMDCPEDAERYLLGCCGSLPEVEVKVIHPYEEFLTEGKLKVQAAVGLTQRHFAAASEFLKRGGGSRRSPTSASKGLLSSLSTGPLLKARPSMLSKIRSNSKTQASDPNTTSQKAPSAAASQLAAVGSRALTPKRLVQQNDEARRAELEELRRDIEKQRFERRDAINKVRYEFEEFVHKKVDKIFSEVEQLKNAEDDDDEEQQVQISGIVNDMNRFKAGLVEVQESWRELVAELLTLPP